MAKEVQLSGKDAGKLDDLNKTVEKYEKKGYRREDLIEQSGLRANLYALLYGSIVSVPLIVIFFFASREVFKTIRWNRLTDAFMFLVVMLVLIVAHELIHGFFFGLFARNGYRSVSFGFNVRALAPYCTCNEPLKKVHYMISGIMPCILLGVIPAIAAIFIHDLFVFEMAILMIYGAGGDLLIMKMILSRKAGPDSMYLDHPVHIGCVLPEK